MNGTRLRNDIGREIATELFVIIVRSINAEAYSAAFLREKSFYIFHRIRFFEMPLFITRFIETLFIPLLFSKIRN